VLNRLRHVSRLPIEVVFLFVFSLPVLGGRSDMFCSEMPYRCEGPIAFGISQSADRELGTK
jgi:hypothetical protein